VLSLIGLNGLTTEDSGVGTLNLLAGASDVDASDILSTQNVTLVSGDDSGMSVVGDSITVDPSLYSYLGDGESEVVEYSYDVVDGNGGVVSQTATITVTGVNDAAVISGDISGTTVEDSGATIAGTLLAADVDNADNVFLMGSGAAAYGTYAVDAAGEWTYTLDDSNADVDALNVGDILTDSFVVLSEDGTPQTVTITIDGANDAPVVTGPVTAAADEDSSIFALDLLSGASDVDSASLSVVAGSVSGLQPGMFLAGSTLNVDPSDSFFQSLPEGDSETYTVSFDIIDGDGGLVSQTADITITGTNDLAVLSGVTTGAVIEDNTAPATGTLTIMDADDGESLVQEILPTANNSVSGFGSFEVLADGTWAYTLDSSHSDVQALEIGQTTTDSIIVSSLDGSATLELTVTITGAINYR